MQWTTASNVEEMSAFGKHVRRCGNAAVSQSSMRFPTTSTLGHKEALLTNYSGYLTAETSEDFPVEELELVVLALCKPSSLQVEELTAAAARPDSG